MVLTTASSRAGWVGEARGERASCLHHLTLTPWSLQASFFSRCVWSSSLANQRNPLPLLYDKFPLFCLLPPNFLFLFLLFLLSPSTGSYSNTHEWVAVVHRYDPLPSVKLCRAFTRLQWLGTLSYRGFSKQQEQSQLGSRLHPARYLQLQPAIYCGRRNESLAEQSVTSDNHRLPPLTSIPSVTFHNNDPKCWRIQLCYHHVSGCWWFLRIMFSVILGVI